MADALATVFQQYAGGAEMDGRSFVKLFKDMKMVDSKLSTNDLDLIFAKVKAKGSRKINCTNFRSSLQHIAEKKKVSIDAIAAKLSKSDGPQFNSGTTQVVEGGATKFNDAKTFTGAAAAPDAPSTGGYSGLDSLISRDHVQDDALQRKKGETKDVPVGLASPQGRSKKDKPLRGPERFFYDQKSYTGAHAQGGPSTKDGGGYSDLSNLTDRGHTQNDALHRKAGGTSAGGRK